MLKKKQTNSVLLSIDSTKLKRTKNLESNNLCVKQNLENLILVIFLSG